MTRATRRGMIERNPPLLSVGMPCRRLSLPRSSFHCEPQSEIEMNLALMLLINKPFLDTPGAQQMTGHRKNEGHPANVKRVRRLMRLMRLVPIFQRPDRLAGQGRRRAADRLLQSPAASRRPWRAAARRGYFNIIETDQQTRGVA